MTKENGGSAHRSRLVWLVAAQTTSMVLLGLWVTHVAAGRGPLALEGRVSQAFAEHRSPVGNGLTSGLTLLAGTEGIVGVTLLCVAALLVLPSAPRWREAAFLGGSVAVQSAVFLVVTFFVERPRPDVPQLDGAPPTSSFPSGHVGASVALYGGLAALVLSRTRGPWRYLTAGVLLLLPPAVGLSRVYRGMHHPSDVLGGLLNGAATLLVLGCVFLSGRGAADGRTPKGTGTRTPKGTARGGPAGPARPAPLPLPDGRRRGGRAVVVRHPRGCPDGLADEVRDRLRRHGFTTQRWTSTTVDRPCGSLAEECAAGGVGLVVVCGGDGTVRVCADVVAGTGIPLALVPCGTGNLLARNLGLPSDPATALDEALAGGDFSIDVGRVRGDGLPPTRFTVMAGAGFDAAMVRDASEVLKAHLGWAAYALSAVRHLRDPRMRLSVRLDGGRRIRRRARMVVVGNVGALQAGLELLPRARPDSGRLEVVLFDPRGAVGWLAAAAHLASRVVRRPGAAPAAGGPGGAVSVAAGSLEYFGATRIEVRFARAQDREVDGDTVGRGARLTVETEPGALRIRLPHAPGAVPAPSGAPGCTSRTAPTAHI
ncbi:diacylglycerol kinase family protein [Streptomyces sp. NRRL F-4474]|uniref:diacylglycerol kinase family protein n=1 Tax=Streptomyces sp. NRRL F-4474 TaxID=1463851 RepID=UPI00099DC2D0|nr:diacylglycerol kinase family protein [Streptomyces sp. NRRL F-4474]